MSHLVQMRTFLEVYRSGSISKAADRLAMTQPAASAHVRALEAVLEKPLFVRTARGVDPTPAAHELARVIGAPLDAIEAGLGAFKARSSILSGTIRIAGPAEFLGHRVAPRLAGLVDLGLKVRLLTGNREQIYGWLDDDTVELAVTASRPADRSLGFAEIARERLLLVAGPDLARRFASRPPEPAALAATPLIAYDEDLPLVRHYLSALFGTETEMEAAITAPDLRIVARLVAAGAGWSVLPDYLCGDAIRAGALVTLDDAEPGLDNALYLVWTKAALRHPRVAFVRDRLLEEAKQGAFAIGRWEQAFMPPLSR